MTAETEMGTGTAAPTRRPTSRAFAYEFNAAPYEPDGFVELVAALVFSLAIFLVPATIIAASNGALTSAPRLVWRTITKAARPEAAVREDYARIGVEGAANLFMEREMTRMMAIMTFLAFVVLIPAHASGSGPSAAWAAAASHNAQQSYALVVRTTIQNVPVDPESAAWNRVAWLHVAFVYVFTFVTWRFVWHVRAGVHGMAQLADASSPSGGSGGSDAEVGRPRSPRSQQATTTRRAAECAAFVSGPPKSLSSEDELLQVLNTMCPPGRAPRSVRLLKRDGAFNPKVPWRAVVTFGAAEWAREFIAEYRSFAMRRSRELLQACVDERRESVAAVSAGALPVSLPAATGEDVGNATASSKPHQRRSLTPTSSSTNNVEPVVAGAAAAATTTTTPDGNATPGRPRNQDDDDDDDATALLAPPAPPRGPPPAPSKISEKEAQFAEELTRLARLRVEEWRVQRAPDSNDIMYDALSVSPAEYWTRQILTTVGFLAALIFLTTPVTLISFISSTNPHFSSQLQSSYSSMFVSLKDVTGKFADFLFQYLPFLFLIVCDAWLLFGVQLLSQYEPHVTHSGRESSVMRKSFAFLMFNSLLLPCLALTSVGAFMAGLLVQDDDEEASNVAAGGLLARVFVTSTGAFGLCFVATQTWVGAAMDISRLSERVWLFVKQRVLRVPLPAPFHAGGSMMEMEYGSTHAMNLTVLSICLVFSTVVPLILPFGCVYFCSKAGVDEYLLTHVYAPHPLDQSLHALVARSAVNLVHVPLLMFQSAVLGLFWSEACLRVSAHVVGGGATAATETCVVPTTGEHGTLVPRGTTAQVALLAVVLAASTVHAVLDWRGFFVTMSRLA